MSLDRIRYELKLNRKVLLLAPALAIVPVIALVIMQHVLRQDSARVALAGLEMLLPLAGGVTVAGTCAGDAALELHLTTLHPYSATGMLRVLLIFCWVACMAMAGLAILALANLLRLPTFAASYSPLVRALALQLLWLAPFVWLGGVGLCLALLTRSRSASGTLLGGLWLLNVLFVGTIAQTIWLRPVLLFPATLVIFPATAVSRADFGIYWLTTRFELLGTGLVLFMLGWLLLHNAESLLKGASEE
ncbi:MAG: hypothetical protein ACRDHP_20880 [Ktedonobacterales bacterium]